MVRNSSSTILASSLSLFLSFMNSAQQLEWTCSSSGGNESTYFPNVPIDNSSIADSVQDSPYLSNFYIYQFPPLSDSCNGKTFVEFCFENSDNVRSIVMTIVLGRIEDILSDSTLITATVMERIDINATVNCNPLFTNDSVCCHSEKINTSLPTQINTFGVFFPSQLLLEYNNSQHQEETFVATNVNLVGVDRIGQLMVEVTGHTETLNLRFLRFFIDELTNDPTSQPPTASNIQMIIGAAVSVAGSLLIVLLTVTVVLLAIKLRRNKGKITIAKLTEEEGFDNVNYGNRALVKRGRNSERSNNVYHDYAVASSTINSHIRAASYEKPLISSYYYEEEEDIYEAPARDEHTLRSQIKKHICNRESDAISLKAVLGSGQFGTVHKGEWVASEGGERIEVAVKTLKEGAAEEDKVKFLQEAAIMGQFSHPNVIKLYGVVAEGEPVLLILELLPQGDLRKVLNRIDPHLIDTDLPHTLLSYCRQVASGMSYLSNKLFVHRDLAARNILVSEDGACKIADFGMSRDLTDADYYLSQGGKIPVKWTAPEAILYKKYSTASDVWSFGCVMYEIWSLGHKPFEEHTNVDCIKIVNEGIRLAPPPGCPREIYKLMIDYWHPNPSSRPDFASMLQQLTLPDTKLLKWSEEDKASDPEAATLGAGLNKAVNLYKDLQQQYKSS